MPIVFLLIAGLGVALVSRRKPDFTIQPVEEKPRRTFGEFTGPTTFATPVPTDFTTHVCDIGEILGLESQENREILELILQEFAKADYDQLNARARKEGAGRLNEDLGTTLTGEESFEQVMAQLGGLGGSAVCGEPAGPCSAVGRILGAYLGRKVGDYMVKNSCRIRDWVRANIGSVDGAIEEFENFFGI